jgi:hypothetical protein
MEPEGSIPCSQEPSTGRYPEPYQSNHITSINSVCFEINYLSWYLDIGRYYLRY